MVDRTLACLVLLVATLGACPSDDTGGRQSDLGDSATGFDTTLVTTSPGTTDASAASDTAGGDITIVPGGFGAPCEGNVDCTSSYCVEGTDGFVCTRSCVDDCPDGYDCRGVGTAGVDLVFLCLPRVRKLCVPCLEDFQCAGGACLTIDGEQQCATACANDGECPSGYGCKPDATRDATFCQPLSGSCSCSPIYEGVARACTNTSALGTCVGAESCDPNVGWVGCSAREPATESCNYIDDDCDGSVDEDFQESGVYADDDACGSCTTDCNVVLPNTLSTRCAVTGGLARCEVVECEPGFSLLNPYVCAPDAGSLCQPCVSNAECLGNGAACTPLTDGTFCTTACDEAADCADGFVCAVRQMDGIPMMQCVPASGSCTCDGSNTDLSRACSVTYTPPDPELPSVVCKGLEQCTVEGWGGCVLPVEACDGIDNDCDGVVDQPFKTSDKYTTVQHCGACDINCSALSGPNAAPGCDASGAVPVCGFSCIGDARDVNGIANDGCECIPIAGPDLAGDSLDSNCDGIDGEVDNGIFVAKSGSGSNPGTRELPLLDVQSAIAAATAQGKRDVYVATGVYSENIVLAQGIGVFGGYSPFFDEHDVVLYETALVGQTPSAGQPGTVTAIGLGTTPGAAETVLDGLTIFGISAANLPAQNSYAIYIRDSGAGLRIAHNRILAGPGGNGTNGDNGNNGGSGQGGVAGGAARNLPSDCTTFTAGGNGGAQSCGGTNVNGGLGGTALCAAYEVAPYPEQNGVAGGNGGGSGGESGWDFLICAASGTFGTCSTALGATSADCGSCLLPPDQHRFTGEDGDPGNNGTSGAFGNGCGAPAGSVASNHWVGTGGGLGGAGAHGAGGGGGGAGGGVEVRGNACNGIGNDDLGGSGGGGGAGGCAGTGGTGATAGGGSFGIFVIGGIPTIAANTIQGGRGGSGGNGGPGGVGGVGGSGGSGGVSGDTLGQANVQCAQGGGSGGEGGDGGHGGGGGGGCGGASYGIYASVGTAPAAWKTANSFVAGATGGPAGKGGASIDQTKAGRDGQAGAAANTNF